MIEAVEGRFSAPRSAGVEVRLAGHAHAGVSGALTARGVALGSSFALTGGTPEDGYASLWAHGAVSHFDGREGELTLDGEVTSAMLGADVSRERGVAGLMLSHARGDGSYRGEGEGEVASTLTGLYPYGCYRVNDRVTLWGRGGLRRGRAHADAAGPAGDAHRHGPHDGRGGGARRGRRGGAARRLRACGQDRRDGGAHDVGEDAGAPRRPRPT